MQNPKSFKPRIALVTPFSNDENNYIELHKEILRANGYHVFPMNAGSLKSRRISELLRRPNILTVHWLEARAFKKTKGGTMQLSIVGLAAFFFYATLMCISRARVIYFLHNHAVHDTTGWRKSISRVLIKVMTKCADATVVHDPSSTSRYKAHYLPHPLYWDNPESPQCTGATDCDGEIVYLALGAIRRYKELAQLLVHWPRNTSLLIAGGGDKAYIEELRNIISQRKLETTVSLKVKYLPSAEFSQLLTPNTVLILPHASDSMLVSGTFFEGYGRVACIISRRHGFIEWAKCRGTGIISIDDFSGLDDLIPKVTSQLRAHELTPATSDARRLFGWQHCIVAYGRLFSKLSERLAPK